MADPFEGPANVLFEAVDDDDKVITWKNQNGMMNKEFNNEVLLKGYLSIYEFSGAPHKKRS